mmetsp:Transcript_12722/g.32507  ORF Transcript_12722/g.32507 Transcript_12722/m.32507 type:complete len:237 (+) Transcript_12722:751-1461(+)
MMGAYLLISRNLASTFASSASSVTRSILLSSSRSANATCSTASFSAPSGFSSSRCCVTCFASTRVTMPSRRANSLIDSSMKNVCATGPGSARPVVSIMIPSRSARRRKSFERIRMRSPRTVQQMQPLFISKMSSVVLKRSRTSASSTPTSPNSFSMIAIFLPWLTDRMWLRSVVLPEPSSRKNAGRGQCKGAVVCRVHSLLRRLAHTQVACEHGHRDALVVRHVAMTCVRSACASR